MSTTKIQANREYKVQGIMIDGERANVTFHRTFNGAYRTARRLSNAYDRRRLQIRVEIRRLGHNGKYWLVDDYGMIEY